MSKPLPSADTDEPPEPEINQTVEEEENNSQTTSIRRIQKFRDHLAEYQVWFAQNEISQEVTREQQVRSYHRMAQGFLRVLTPYLTDDTLTTTDGDDTQSAGNQYWYNADLGAFTADPPNILLAPTQTAAERAIRDHNPGTIARVDPRAHADAKKYRVRGLREFANTDPQITVSWTVMFGPKVSVQDLRSELDDGDVIVKDRPHRNEPITVEKRVQLPKAIIDNAVTAMENFIRELGLDIDFEEEEQQTKIDRDLLEEVDAWRQKNVKQ